MDNRTKMLVLGILCSSMFGGATLLSQPSQELPGIVLVRLKPVNISPALDSAFHRIQPALHAELRTSASFHVPDDKTIEDVLLDEDVEPDDLLHVDDLCDVGEVLKSDYILVGSALQSMMSVHTHLRIYAVSDRRLVGVVSSGQNIAETEKLIKYLAERIRLTVAEPVPLDSLYREFKWSQRLRLVFGTDRVDLQPPRVYFVNDNPPFELSVRVFTEHAGGSFRISNVSLYVDDESIGDLHTQLSPPIILRRREVTIGGRSFYFQIDVKEIRGRTGVLITGADIVVTAWPSDE